VFSHDSVNGIRVQVPTFFLIFSITAEQTKHRPVHIVRVPCQLQVGAKALRCLRMNSQCVTSAAFAGDTQRVVCPVLMQVADRKRRDFCPTQTDLQSDQQNGAVAKHFERVDCRSVK
jgi:hypothetical protein